MPAAATTMDSTVTARMAICRCSDEPAPKPVTTRNMRTTRKMRKTRSVRATSHALGSNVFSLSAMETMPGTMVKKSSSASGEK